MNGTLEQFAIRAFVWLGYLVFASELLPLAGALYTRTRNPARWKVAVFGMTSFGFDVATRIYTIVTHRNNLWLGYLIDPLMVVIAIAALADWQLGRAARLAVWLLIPACLLIQGVLFLRYESPATFSLVTSSVLFLTLLCLALMTMIRCSLAVRARVSDQDWFWVCLGFALYSGMETGFGPLQRYLLATGHRSLFIAAAYVQLANSFGVMLLLTRAMFCPAPSPSDALAGAVPA